jgi:hypothetical protein
MSLTQDHFKINFFFWNVLSFLFSILEISHVCLETSDDANFL